MVARIENSAEPIPGYRLIERLGGGGFGEVWKCEAPGGLFKAIKFVYGDLEAADEDGARAEQELKALSRVKTVHHPYILSLERYDIIDGQLLIVMELADRTLWDRFKESRGQGFSGIPREELLGYLEETAEALDLMNNQYQLQHLDIKPQNLFLVHNHVKVADFGLVKDLEGMMASVTGGVTPVYAAPETFDGWVSRFSDQYSLAIVYEELLTGQRPFNGTSVRQLVMQHLQSAPDLTPLPPVDRPFVARALSKNPDDRYPTCLEFIRDLRSNTQATDKTSGGSQKEEIREIPTPPPGEPRFRPEDVPPPLSTGSQLTEKAPSNRGSSGRHKDASTTPGPEVLPGFRPPPFVPRATPAKPAAAENGSSGFGTQKTPFGTTNSTTIHPPHRHAAQVARGDGVLVPALVVGLGQMGQLTLKQLRREIFEHFGSAQALPQLRFFCLDTDADAAQTASQGGEQALQQNELLLAKLHRPSHYIKPRDSQSSVESWLNPKMLYRIPRQQVPAGVRALGRLAFVDSYPAIARRLEAELRACCDPETWQEVARQTGLAVSGPAPRVYIVSNLAGGTGSGMFIDVAYVVKNLLRKLGYNPDVVGLFLLPQPERSAASRAAGLANAYAALTELQHFAAPRTNFNAAYGTSEPQFATTPFAESGPPFQRCILLPTEDVGDAWKTPAEGDSNTAATPPAVADAAHLLFTDLCTPLGRTAEQLRRQCPLAGEIKPSSTDERLLFQTVGTYRILWPRRQLLGHTGRQLCRRLVQRWMTKDAKPLRDGIKQWVGEQWSEQRLRPEDLITHMHEACERHLNQKPETVFAALLEPLAPVVATKGRAQDKNGKPAVAQESFGLATVIEIMDRLEQMLGVPEECQTVTERTSSEGPPPGTLVEALKESANALGGDCDLKLAQLIVRLIEQPEFRLAGAEETIRQFNALAEQALQHQEDLTKELQERSVALYDRIYALLESPSPTTTPGSNWRTPFTRKVPTAGNGLGSELIELLRAYPKCRYQSLVLQHVTTFYVGLRGQLSDQLREVDFCRQRLGELGGMWSDEGVNRAGSPLARTALGVPQNVGRCLFPGGSKDLQEAVARQDKGVSAEDLQALDHRMQELIRKQFRALVHVCTTASHVLRNLAPVMQQEAEAFLSERIGSEDVTQMYLAQHGAAEESSEEVRDAIADAFEEAVPDLTQSGGTKEIALLAAPHGPAEERFRSLVRQALPSSLATAVSDDEIIFYREQLHQGLADLKQFVALAREAYQQAASQEHLTPHSRIDIPEWRALADS